MKKNMTGISMALVTLVASVSLPVSANDMLGKQVYEKWCIECHAAGKGYPGTWMMALKSGEDKAVLAERKDLSAGRIKSVTRRGIGGMPSFRPTEISDSELDALIKYIRQPSDNVKKE